jgi:hypothetical protein
MPSVLIMVNGQIHGRDDRLRSPCITAVKRQQPTCLNTLGRIGKTKWVASSLKMQMN